MKIYGWIYIIICSVIGQTFAINGDLGVGKGADGTEGKPWLIEDIQDFDYFSNNTSYWGADKYIKMMCNIDLSDRIFNKAPVAGSGNNNNSFNGKVFSANFNGNGYAIKNLFVKCYAYCGLFGKTDNNCTIKNIMIEKASLNCEGDYSGVLVGWNSASISNCQVTGIITGGSGLVGYNRKANISNCQSRVSITNGSGLVDINDGGNINNCHSVVTVKSGSGLVGINRNGNITNCYSIINATRSNGGLVAEHDGGTISYCFSIGTVSGINNVGGLVGVCNSGSIMRCYSISSVSGKNYIGGLVGSLMYSSSISESYSNSDVNGAMNVGGLVGINDQVISECFSLGSVTGEYNIGGLIGHDTGTISNCYSKSVLDGENYVGGLVGCNFPTDNITKSFSVGTISGTYMFGGLIGENSGNTTSSFWNKDTGGLNSQSGGKGKTTAELYDVNTFLTVGWDFANEVVNGTQDTWVMPGGGNSYPKLTWEPSHFNFKTIDNIIMNEGSAFSFEIWLAEQPKENVIFNVFDGNTVFTNITFTPLNYNQPQLVSVNIQEDYDRENNLMTLVIQADGYITEAIILDVVDNDNHPDLNNNFSIGLDDLTLIAENWLNVAPEMNIYGDTKIDLFDFAVLSAYWLKKFSILDGFEYGELNKSTLNWFFGENHWAVDNETSSEGIYSLKTTPIDNSQSCMAELTLDTDQYSTIKFDRKISCEQYYDTLRFYIDNQMKGYWSGELNWEEFEYPVNGGVQSFKWEYIKDSSDSAGYDCAWIDNIRIE